MQRRSAQSFKMSAHLPPCKSADRDGGIGGAKPRCANLGYGFSQSLGHQSKPDHIAHFALVRGHAKRCIPLHMLDRNKPLLMRQP